MKLLVVILGLLMFGHTSFSQRVPDAIIVLPQAAVVPATAQLLGHISAGNNSTAVHCDYVAVVSAAKRKAAALGGNLVHITSLKSPTFISSCYAIEADVYHVGDINPFAKLRSMPLADTPGRFATLYVYRLKDTLLPSEGYNLHLGKDSVLCRMHGKTAHSFCFDKPGKIALWAQTGVRREILLDLEPGKSYYLRCGIAYGAARQLPVLEVVDAATGAAEYRGLEPHGAVSDPAYLKQVR